MSDEGRCETCEHWCLPVRHRGRWCEVLKLVTGSAESCEYYEAVVARDVTIEGEEGE